MPQCSTKYTELNATRLKYTHTRRNLSRSYSPEDVEDFGIKPSEHT